MKPQELRIGNYVKGSKGIAKVDKLYRQNNQDDHTIEAWYIEPKIQMMGCCEDSIKPIPITEKWLIKCGCENDRPPYRINDFEIYIDDDGRATIYFEGHYLSEFYYLHQFQNIIFDLIKVELDIKL